MAAPDSAYVAQVQAAIAADASGDTATAQAAIEAAHQRYLQLNRGATTTGGLPYPFPLDPTFELADAIRRLAESISFAVGTVADTASLAVQATRTYNITFPAGRFSAPPQIIGAFPVANVGAIAVGPNPTAAGAALYLSNMRNAAYAPQAINWFAIQIPALGAAPGS